MSHRGKRALTMRRLARRYEEFCASDSAVAPWARLRPAEKSRLIEIAAYESAARKRRTPDG